MTLENISPTTTTTTTTTTATTVDTSTVKNDPHGGLSLDPPERIEFRQQHLTNKSVKVVIKNPTQKRIAFKINATSPKRYRIKPSRAILYPGQSEKVDISLRPLSSNGATTSTTNTANTDNESSLSEEKSQGFDFKNDRFEVKYFYFDEQDNQHLTSDTDTISIYVND